VEGEEDKTGIKRREFVIDRMNELTRKVVIEIWICCWRKEIGWGII
jgi:hypothetical protein